MQNYELLYIVSSQFTDDELKPIREEVVKIVEKHGGQIGKDEFLGKKKLAYPINKVIHGYYAMMEFELEDPSTLKEINAELKLYKKVLRAQIIIKAKGAEEKNKRKRRETDRPTAEEIKEVTAPEVPAPSRPKPERTKDLDEKLEEILKDDDIV